MMLSLASTLATRLTNDRMKWHSGEAASAVQELKKFKMLQAHVASGTGACQDVPILVTCQDVINTSHAGVIRPNLI